MDLERADMITMTNNCDGCCHNGSYGYFSELNNYPLDEDGEISAFEEFCVSCCCGDGCECNRDQGCNNYETEPIMG